MVFPCVSSVYVYWLTNERKVNKERHMLCCNLHFTDEVSDPHSGNYVCLHIPWQIIRCQLMSVIILYN